MTKYKSSELANFKAVEMLTENNFNDSTYCDIDVCQIVEQARVNSKLLSCIGLYLHDIILFLTFP